jgi:hypothetical protein
VGRFRNGEARRALGRQSRHPAERADLKLRQSDSQGGREMAAGELPRAEAALRQELQSLADAA